MSEKWEVKWEVKNNLVKSSGTHHLQNALSTLWPDHKRHGALLLEMVEHLVIHLLCIAISMDDSHPSALSELRQVLNNWRVIL